MTDKLYPLYCKVVSDLHRNRYAAYHMQCMKGSNITKGPDTQVIFPFHMMDR